MDKDASPYSSARPALEDSWLDLIEKARQGLGIDQCSLCTRAGIDNRQWRQLKSGRIDEDAIGSVAKALGLGIRGTLMLARDQYAPPSVSVDGLLQLVMPFPMLGSPDGTVNAYLIYDKDSSDALVFDGGTEAEPFFAAIEKLKLNVRAVFITHTHRDHIGALPSLHSSFPDAPVYAHHSELLSDCMKPVEDGETLSIGAFTVEARHTPGHSTGSMCYVVEGLERPVAIVGDALFAGSAGRSGAYWKTAIETLKNRILSLPEGTLICPGHGPTSTVEYERRNNPLFPHLS
ncbi:MAG: MBL fold metallo-hydrolase [Opitutales bacterium]|nr:MBL fold metallo-hydrolase [Opitutales bacterium]